ncbi:MAG TPA: hypothetical protein VE152_02715, partial [Acidimicrobiales bacterium]|nr:hypothetical protein [Acidimicrobiales bacterium]
GPAGRRRPTGPRTWAPGIGATSGALALVVLAALPAAFLARAFTRPLPAGDGQGSHASVPALVRQAQHRLDALGARRVLVQIDDNRQWPVALGVAATLQGAGDHISLAYPYWKRLARWLRPDGRATAAVVLGDTAPGPAPPPGTVAFTSTQGPGAMWVTRLPPGAVSAPGPTAPGAPGHGRRPGQVPQAGAANPRSSSSRVRTP